MNSLSRLSYFETLLTQVSYCAVDLMLQMQELRSPLKTAVGGREMLSKRVERDLWARQMDELLASWREADAGSEANFLRGLFEFVKAAPHRDFTEGLSLHPVERFATLLELRAFPGAVLEWLADESSFMISRSPDGLHIATVVLAGQGIESTAKARTGGLALAGAILLSLAEANAL